MYVDVFVCANVHTQGVLVLQWRGQPGCYYFKSPLPCFWDMASIGLEPTSCYAAWPANPRHPSVSAYLSFYVNSGNQTKELMFTRWAHHRWKYHRPFNFFVLVFLSFCFPPDFIPMKSFYCQSLLTCFKMMNSLISYIVMKGKILKN